MLRAYRIYDYGGEYGTGHRITVNGIFGTAYELVVVVSVKAAEDGEDDDCEDGDDYAA